jgi:hypothetical protein
MSSSVLSRVKSVWEACEEELASDPLRDYVVHWLEVLNEDADEFEECLTDAKREEDYLACMVTRIGPTHRRVFGLRPARRYRASVDRGENGAWI